MNVRALVITLTLTLTLTLVSGTVTSKGELLNQVTAASTLSPGESGGAYFQTRIMVSSTNTQVTVRTVLERPRSLSAVTGWGLVGVWDAYPSISIARNDSVLTHTLSYDAEANTAPIIDYRAFPTALSSSPNASLDIEVAAGIPSSGNRWLHLVVWVDYDNLDVARVSEFTIEARIEDPTGTIAAIVAGIAFVLLSVVLFRLQKKHAYCHKLCSPKRVTRPRKNSAVEQQESYEYDYQYGDGEDDEDDDQDDGDGYEYAYEYPGDEETSMLGGGEETSALSGGETSALTEDPETSTSALSESQSGGGGGGRKKKIKRGAKKALTSKGGQAAVGAGVTAGARQQQRRRKKKKRVRKSRAERRAETRADTPWMAYPFIFLIRVMYLIFDGVRTIINLQLIAASLSLYVSGLPSVDSFKEFVPLGSFSTVLFSPNAFLEYFEDFQDAVEWNCGGTLLLLFPWLILIVMAVFAIILERDLLLWVAIRFLGHRPKSAGRVGLMLFAAASALLTSVLLYIVQLFVLILPSILQGMWSVERSCSSVDNQMMLYMFIGNLVITVIAFVILLVSFAGRPTGSVAKLGILAPVAVILGSLRRLVYLTFGIWTNRLIESYSIRERAIEFDDDIEDDDTQEERVLSIMGRSRALIWLVAPMCIVLAKLSETVNNPPLFVFGGGGNPVEMTTPTAARALILIFHLATYGLLLAVVVLGGEVLFRLMLGSLIPLHLFLLVLDFYGVSADS